MRSRPATIASRSAALRMPTVGEHAGVRLRPRDIVSVEPLVEADRGVNLLHQRCRAALEMAAPQSRRAPAGSPLLAGLPLTVGSGEKEGCPHEILPLRLAGAAGADHPTAGRRVQLRAERAQAGARADLLRRPRATRSALDDFRGQVVVLNLWATWCAPCRHEMPSLDRLQARHRRHGPAGPGAVARSRRARARSRPSTTRSGSASLAIYHDPRGAPAARSALSACRPPS